jgi:hypothetical protein
VLHGLDERTLQDLGIARAEIDALVLCPRAPALFDAVTEPIRRVPGFAAP